jgi:hypothetical protein
MVVSNANSHRPAINFSHLLTKMNAELSGTTPKKPRIAKKFYPTEAQRRFLDVCEYNDFLNPPSFDSVREVTQFVTEHADYKNEFERKYSGMSCPGMHSVSRNH